MKFICKSCGHRFESNQDNDVLCPKCHSDNVTPNAPSKVKLVVFIISIILVAIITFFIIRSFKKTNAIENESKNEIVVSEIKNDNDNRDFMGVSPEDNVNQKETRVKPEDVIKEPVTIITSALSEHKGFYSFTAQCENLPKGVKVKYEIMDSFGKNVIQESFSGDFTHVPASKDEDGTYKVVVKDIENGECLATVVIGGFVKKIAKVKKINKEDLERLINNKSKTLLQNPSISSSVVLSFVNISKEEKKPIILADVIDKIELNFWDCIEVVSVDYDERDCIKAISMKITYSTF